VEHAQGEGESLGLSDGEVLPDADGEADTDFDTLGLLEAVLHALSEREELVLKDDSYVTDVHWLTVFVLDVELEPVVECEPEREPDTVTLWLTEGEAEGEVLTDVDLDGLREPDVDGDELVLGVDDGQKLFEPTGEKSPEGVCVGDFDAGADAESLPDLEVVVEPVRVVVPEMVQELVSRLEVEAAFVFVRRGVLESETDTLGVTLMDEDVDELIDPQEDAESEGDTVSDRLPVVVEDGLLEGQKERDRVRETVSDRVPVGLTLREREPCAHCRAALSSRSSARDTSGWTSPTAARPTSPWCSFASQRASQRPRAWPQAGRQRRPRSRRIRHVGSVYSGFLKSLFLIVLLFSYSCKNGDWRMLCRGEGCTTLS
jgi:hypothetical protein